MFPSSIIIFVFPWTKILFFIKKNQIHVARALKPNDHCGHYWTHVTLVTSRSRLLTHLMDVHTGSVPHGQADHSGQVMRWPMHEITGRVPDHISRLLKKKLMRRDVRLFLSFTVLDWSLQPVEKWLHVFSIYELVHFTPSNYNHTNARDCIYFMITINIPYLIQLQNSQNLLKQNTVKNLVFFLFVC